MNPKTPSPDTLPSPPPGLALGLKVIARRPTDDPLRDTHGSTHGGFPWPLAPGAVVSAPDWTPEPECGGGLHLFPFGEGNLSVALGVDDDVSIWQVVAYDPSTAVDLRGKVKVPECVVVLTDYGTTGRARAATYIVAHAPGHCTHFATATAGEGGTATAGYGGTATAGDRGTATAGEGGTATAGDRGTATAGEGGTATAGYRGTATAGDRGTATAGDYGTATAGYRGTATAGYGGTATAGYRGTATAGYGGTATAGEGGTATAGYRGTATAGSYGTATAGDDGTATAGSYGTATAGEGGTATAGEGGTATAGEGGTATAGYRGTATAGDYGTATAGDYGTATAGYGGALGILYYDSTRCVYRRRVAEVDGDRILPGVAYRLDDAGRFVRADGGVS